MKNEEKIKEYNIFVQKLAEDPNYFVKIIREIIKSSLNPDLDFRFSIEERADDQGFYYRYLLPNLQHNRLCCELGHGLPIMREYYSLGGLEEENEIFLSYSEIFSKILSSRECVGELEQAMYLLQIIEHIIGYIESGYGTI